MNVSNFKEQARVLKALSNEARLAIVNSLSGGEKTVSQLVSELKIEQSALSKHLSILRMNNIVVDRRDGNNIYYKLLTPCVVRFLSCATEVIQEKKKYLIKIMG